MKLQGIAFLFPDWIMPWLAVAALLALLSGAHRLSLFLALVPVGRLVAAPLLLPLLGRLPLWVSAAVTTSAFLLGLQTGLSLLFGREVASHVVASILLRIVDALLAIPRKLAWDPLLALLARSGNDK